MWKIWVEILCRQIVWKKLDNKFGLKSQVEKLGGKVRRMIFLKNCVQKMIGKWSGKDRMNSWVTNLKETFVGKWFKNSLNKFNGKIVWENCVEKLCEKNRWKNCVPKLC